MASRERTSPEEIKCIFQNRQGWMLVEYLREDECRSDLIVRPERYPGAPRSFGDPTGESYISRHFRLVREARIIDHRASTVSHERFYEEE